MNAILNVTRFATALLILCAAERTPASEATGINLTIALAEDRWFRDENIPLRVTVSNETDEELAVCREDSRAQKKLIVFRLFDDAGKDVTAEPALHVDYGVEADGDTIVLPPKGEHVATLHLQREYLPRHGGCRTLNAVAVYQCPFGNDDIIGGRRLRVAGGVYTSSSVPVRIDSRSWLSRVFGGDCR